MTKNYSQIIGTLKEAAIGRCRQRIDEAAMKVQDIAKKPHDEIREERPPCTGREEFGVTSILKKRHGL